MVGEKGLEPLRIATLDPKSSGHHLCHIHRVSRLFSTANFVDYSARDAEKCFNVDAGLIDF